MYYVGNVLYLFSAIIFGLKIWSCCVIKHEAKPSALSATRPPHLKP